MLEVFRELEIRGRSDADLNNFAAEIGKALPRGWKRDRSRERELSNTATYLVVKTKPSVQPSTARLFLVAERHLYKLTNIVPEFGSLTRKQYNLYVEQFCDAARNIVDELGLTMEMTDSQFDFLAALPIEVFQALQRFSFGANKSTGSSHPADRNRWLEFITLAHTENVRIDTDLLRRWLIEEQRWTEDQAFDLQVEYEFGRDLLAKHDEMQ